MKLENTEKLEEHALSRLAKIYGVPREEVLRIFNNLPCDIDIQNKELRGEVNKWWKRKNGELVNLGFGSLNKAKGASKLPDNTYVQVAAIVLVEKQLQTISANRKKREEITRRAEQFRKAREFEEANRSWWSKLWQKIADFFKNLFKMKTR